jgi:hypothetical protein
VLSLADLLGDGPVARRELREEFLTFESTPVLYAPDHPPPIIPVAAIQSKTFPRLSSID